MMEAGVTSKPTEKQADIMCNIMSGDYSAVKSSEEMAMTDNDEWMVDDNDD